MIEGFSWLHDLLLLGGVFLLCSTLEPLINHWYAWKASRREKR